MVPEPIKGLSIGLPNWLSTVPQYLLLRPRDGGNISYALGRDRQGSSLYEALAKAAQTEGCCQYDPAGLPRSLPYAMLVGIADSGQPPNPASCCTISCVIEEVARHW